MLGLYVQMIDIGAMPLKERGVASMNETTVPMIPKTMVHVAWLVSTFISTVKVRM